MHTKIVYFILLVTAGSTTAAKRQPFNYRQAFSPPQTVTTMRDGRLQYDDVRAEGNLSSRILRAWKLADGGAQCVGSRRAEMYSRERNVKDKYLGHESFVTIRGYRVPWLTLSMGDLDWVDYTVQTTVKPGPDCTTGLAFRYQNSRQYYALILEDQQKASLVLRTQDREASMGTEAWTRLKSVAFDVSSDQTYDLIVQVRGTHVTCFINDNNLIEHDDMTLRSGKVALFADNPAFFGPVSVEGTLIRPQLPPLPKCAKPQILHEVNLPKVERRLHFFFLDVDDDKLPEIIIAERNKGQYAYRCLEFDGSQLWHIDGITNPITEGGDNPIQVFDINGDGKNEIVLIADFQIQVRNGKTAELLYSCKTPKPNPYYDSRGYRYPLLLGDALCQVRLNPDDPPGLYIKDRYTNIWLYDHKLKLKWQKALSTGHFPLPLDIDNDGAEEILTNHTLLDTDGNEIWSLPLSDHVDNIASASLDPGKKPRRFYLAAGEMGLLEIDVKTGRIYNRFELGHIQFVRIADFLPEKPGLELLTQTWWREDQLHYLFDKDMILIATWQAETGENDILPWGENGRDLLLTTTGIRDPLTGRKIRDPFGRYLMVLDDPRWGKGIVLVSEDDRIIVYGPQKGFDAPARKRPYQDIQSSYLPMLSLPVNK